MYEILLNSKRRMFVKWLGETYTRSWIVPVLALIPKVLHKRFPASYELDHYDSRFRHVGLKIQILINIPVKSTKWSPQHGVI